MAARRGPMVRRPGPAEMSTAGGRIGISRGGGTCDSSRKTAAQPRRSTLSRRVGTLIAASVVIVIGAVSGASAAAQPPGLVPGLPVYVALGDSWAAGDGASAPSQGYVPQLAAALKSQFDCSPARAGQARGGCPQLQFVNFAQNGSTTQSMVFSQFPAALALLEQRNGDRNPRNDVEVVTLHIGGNDVVFPILGACSAGIDASCVAVFQAEMTAYRNDLDSALAALRAAAGDRARIVIGTYDNMAVPPCPLDPALFALIGSGGPVVGPGLRDVMRQVAAQHAVEVAEIFGTLGPNDRIGDCLHPNDSGYDKITQVFLELLT